MQTDITINMVIFSLVMVLFYIITDFFIMRKAPIHLQHNIQRRWIVSIALGLFILYLLFGRGSPTHIYM